MNNRLTAEFGTIFQTPDGTGTVRLHIIGTAQVSGKMQSAPVRFSMLCARGEQARGDHAKGTQLPEIAHQRSQVADHTGVHPRGKRNRSGYESTFSIIAEPS